MTNLLTDWVGTPIKFTKNTRKYLFNLGIWKVESLDNGYILYQENGRFFVPFWYYVNIIMGREK